ncbi:MAG: 50S ribosomal protein L19, partial [Acholeplasmataceae bacterium]
MARLKGQALIAQITQSYIKEVPTFNSGDTVKVYVKIKEGNRERLQLFE